VHTDFKKLEGTLVQRYVFIHLCATHVIVHFTFQSVTFIDVQLVWHWPKWRNHFIFCLGILIQILLASSIQ